MIQNLQGQKVSFPGTKDSMMKVQTLFFPLKYVGDTSHAFKGVIKDIKVWNSADKL